ncbi:MAG: hypothetical protein QOH35_5182 [Acidobacteriaceae bacterium]|nr:hypothetical protein [Acidobacteriaceae bacterium]
MRVVWGGHNRDTVEGKSGGSFVRREGVDQDCLLHRSQATTAIPLQDAKDDEKVQTGRNAAQE